MQPKVDRIKELMVGRQWSASELARQMGVSRSEATRLLKGKRKGGNKVIAGLLKAFPEETVDSLFFLPKTYPNVNTNSKHETFKIQERLYQTVPVKHPEAHQLACTVNAHEGVVSIKQGDFMTTLHIPPGSVDVEFSK